MGDSTLTRGTLYIIRGCSGAGKTTFAKELNLAMKGYRIEADDFMIVNGVYEWKAEKLKYSHFQVYSLLNEYMLAGKGPLILSDTNVKSRDLNIYLELAKEHDYRVVSLVVENRHGNSSIHDVPEKTLRRQESALRQSLKLV